MGYFDSVPRICGSSGQTAPSFSNIVFSLCEFRNMERTYVFFNKLNSDFAQTFVGQLSMTHGVFFKRHVHHKVIVVILRVQIAHDCTGSTSSSSTLESSIICVHFISSHFLLDYCDELQSSSIVNKNGITVSILDWSWRPTFALVLSNSAFEMHRNISCFKTLRRIHFVLFLL